MKKVNFITNLALSLGAASAWASGGPAVDTHAYVYTTTPISSSHWGEAVLLVLDQGKAVRNLDCDSTNLAEPKTAADVLAMAKAPGCAESGYVPTGISSPASPGSESTAHVVHQTTSDRLVFNSTFTFWDDPSLESVVSSQAVFNRKSPDQLNLTSVLMTTADGQNTTVDTEHASMIRVFDAVIQYPAQTANVIEP